MEWSDANPISDSVFKALLGDLELARPIFSVLLRLDIVNLRIVSLEVPAKTPGRATHQPLDYLRSQCHEQRLQRILEVAKGGRSFVPWPWMFRTCSNKTRIQA